MNSAYGLKGKADYGMHLLTEEVEDVSQGVVIGLKRQVASLESDRKRLNEGLRLLREAIANLEVKAEGREPKQWIVGNIDALLHGGRVSPLG